MFFFTEIIESVVFSLSTLHWNDTGVLLTASATTIVVFLTVLHRLFFRMKHAAIRIPELEQNHQPRFRKRDKVRFFAQKVLRKGKHAASQLQQRASAIKQGVVIPEYSRSGRRLRKRERMLILAKRMFQVKQEPPKLLKKEMPSSVLEADLMEGQKPNLPEEVMYLLQSVKVFGHFEKGIFLQLCRHMEILKIEKDKYLFHIGDPDEYMYVIQDGQVNLYISEDEREYKLSEFTAGESLHSLFSILDVLTGHAAPYKTVYARAVKDSTVIRLPVQAFSESFETRQDALVQMVQVIMTRMQRVTFLALHNYLGLSHELLRAGKSSDGRILSVSKLLQSKESLNVDVSSTSQDLGSEDAVDSAFLQERSSGVKEFLTRVQTCPILTDVDQDKFKKIRFEDSETAMKHKDSENARQASLPPSRKKQEELIKILKAAADDNEEELELLSSPRTRSASTSIPRRRHISQESIGERDSQYIVRLDEPEILDLALQDMLQLFGIDDKDILKDKVVLLSVPQGCQLIQEGDQDVCLYFVVYGALKIFQAMQLPNLTEEWQDVTLFHIRPGMLTGQLAVLTGEPSFFSVCAQQHSVLAKLRRQDYYSIMRHYPHMVLNTAHTVVQRASPFTRQIDFALDWTKVEAGKALYRQDTSSDCMYIVLHGRLRSVYERIDGRKELVSEYGRGEIVGMMEALRGTNRSSAMLAVRDTELAKIPEGLLKHIRRRHPGVVSHLVSLMSDKLVGSMLSRRAAEKSHPGQLLTHKHQMGEETKIAYGDVSNHLANLSTVAVLPINRYVPIDKFTIELEHALSAICDSVLHLNSDTIKKRLGQSAMDSSHEYRLMGWLDQQEDLNRIVLYQTDDRMTAWTQRCIRQSDAILIVGNGDSEPEIGELERELESISVRSLKVLVLLHRPDVLRPSRTVEWLNMRGWLTEHLHIKGSKRLFARTRKSKLNEYREKLSRREVDAFSDFSRLARFLTGKSIALVLGGGGARGISQIGVIRALLEAGVPIDLIGGTSIGAFVGGAWACSRDLAIVRNQAAYISSELGAITPKLFDLTYPITSMFSGASFNKGIHAVFQEVQIEDLWIPYYAITTDITSSRMRVHTDGYLWKYVRASMSFTPYLPPLCDPRDGHHLVDGCYVNNVPGSLWRYVRSSMSLSGYLPPICDPKDGHLLMDGGYVNNLPGDVARSRGACRVIAVDVGASSESDFTNYGDQLSGWWLLWKRWTGRWTGHIKVPDMNEIQSRLSYISCHYLLDLVVSSDYCTYLRPPIMQYRTMDFGKWPEILDVGYDFGKSVCTEEWAKQFWQNLFQVGTEQRRMSAQTDELTAIRKKLSVGNLKGNLSFTDLSEILRKKNPEEVFLLTRELSEIDFEMGYESSPETMTAGGTSTEVLSEPDGATSDLDLRMKNAFHSEDSDSSDSTLGDGCERTAFSRAFSSQNILGSSYKYS